MKLPNNQELEKLRRKYPPGTKVQLNRMDDCQAPPPGSIGVIEYVDDAGNIHVRWENGSGLALIEDVDDFHKV